MFRFNSETIRFGLLSLSLALLSPASSAWSQATDLVCSGCVQGTDIENGTIGPNKLIPGSINAQTIANGVIGPNKLIPGSINTATIANDAIRSNKILDGAVKSADIGDGEVTSADIQNGGVTSADIQNGAVTSADIQNGTVTSLDIQDGTITGVDIQDESITAFDMGQNSVFGVIIAPDGVFDVDIADEPGLEFSNSPGFGTLFDLTTVWVPTRTIAVTVPLSGFVTCIATGHADWDTTNIQHRVDLGWDDTGGTTTPVSYNIVVSHTGATVDQRIPITAMHTFIAPGFRTHFYHLKARCISCTAGQIDFLLNSAACMYFPTRY